MPIKISKNRVALSGVPLNLAAEADITSATTTAIGGVASNNVRITGTTTITSLGTADAGITRHVRFAGVLLLTHDATSLILPGGGNITTAANDTAEFLSLGSGNWICTAYKGMMANILASALPSMPQLANGDLAMIHDLSDGLLKKISIGDFFKNEYGLFNVKHDGATGDGVTNDSAAITATLARAVAAGGGLVYFPAGTYLMNTGITWTADNIIVHLALGATLLAGTATTKIITIGNGTIATKNSGVVGNGRINMNGIETSGRAITGSGPLDGVLIQGIEVFNGAATGGNDQISIGGVNGTNRASRILIDRVNVHDVSGGISIFDADNVLTISCTSNDMKGQDCFEYTRVTHGAMIGCYGRNPASDITPGNSVYDIFSGCEDILLLGCQAERT